MREHAPTILAVASLPAGLAGYLLGAAAIRALLPGAADGVLMLFLPLLVAGLCMLPFLVPFLDRKAKADLATHRAQVAAEAAATAGTGADPAHGPGRVPAKRRRRGSSPRR
jgi:hypothetical protein